ncbi:MAG: AAA family ATPase, partial [Candidatus Eisenbacteria bacterium]|nr:AAA family ATPase [Candidatus Eisenbacteria bacterium]
MRIRRLRLVNFKRFADHEILLEPGLNLIVGPNESGKSSIVEAISTVLFADPTVRPRSVRNLEKWGATGAMRLELDFEQGDDSYRLAKDFGAGTSELTHRNEGEIIVDRDEIDRVVHSVVGFESRDAFESIAAVFQGEVASLEGLEGQARRGELVPLLERKMTSSSGRVDAARVIENVNRRIERLRGGLDRSAKHPGPLKRLYDRREELHQRAALIRKRWDGTQRVRSELARDREELDRAKREFDRIDEAFLNEEASRGRKEELARIRTAFDERASKISRVKKLRSDVADAWDTLVQGAREQEKEAIAAKAALDALDDRVETLKSTVPGGGSPLEKRPGIGLGIVGSAALLCIVIPLLAEFTTLVKWLSVAGGAGLGVWTFFLFKRASRVWTAAQEIRSVHTERKRREVALSAALLKLGIRTFEGLEAYAEEQDLARRNV